MINLTKNKDKVDQYKSEKKNYLVFLLVLCIDGSCNMLKIRLLSLFLFVPASLFAQQKWFFFTQQEELRHHLRKLDRCIVQLLRDRAGRR